MKISFHSLGSDQFKDLRQKNEFYIDKSLFIRDVFQQRGIVQLILRPRRFGKSLNLNMLRCFLSEPLATPDLFDGLAIAEDSEIMALRGKEPSVFVSLKELSDTSSWEETLQAVRAWIAAIYREQLPQLEGLALSEAKLVQEYQNGSVGVATLKTSLKFLTSLLQKRLGKQVWLLIDEYDAPLLNAAKCGFLQKALPFFRGLFSNALKTNPSLKKAVMTGVTRISKESIVSGLNNVIVYNMLSKEFMTSFGFTEEETLEALRNAQLENRLQDVKDWYNGYNMNGRAIYNPWSVAQFIASKELQPYWTNTGDEAILKSLLLSPGENPLLMNQNLEMLLQGKSVLFTYSDNTVFDELEKSRNAILTLLFQSGYLTLAENQEFESPTVSVKVPNKEVRMGLEVSLFKWVKSIDKNAIAELEKGLLTANYQDLQRFFSNMAQYLSYYDLSGGKNNWLPVRVYHAFFLGLLTSIASTYELDSNLETGAGRADLLLRPKLASNPAYVIELKVVQREDQLEMGALNALQQIRDKRYMDRFVSKKHTNIHGIGISVYKKILYLRGERLLQHEAETWNAGSPKAGLFLEIDPPTKLQAWLDEIREDLSALGEALAGCDNEAEVLERISQLKKALSDLDVMDFERLRDDKFLRKLRKMLESANETGMILGQTMKAGSELYELNSSLVRAYNKIAGLVKLPPVPSAAFRL